MRQIKYRLRYQNEIVGYEKWYSGKKETEDDKTSASPCWLYSKDGLYWNPIELTHDEKDAWTGLLDKNGKEIYEGDIYKEEVSGKIRIIDIPLVHTCNYGDGLYEGEVIGNVWENGDLLKD